MGYELQNPYQVIAELKAENERLHELISGKAAENPGHPFWKTASREALLELAQFQSATTKEHMKETADLYTENERLRELAALAQKCAEEKTAMIAELHNQRDEIERLQADLKGTQASLRIEREAQAKQLKRIRNAVADLNDVM